MPFKIKFHHYSGASTLIIQQVCMVKGNRGCFHPVLTNLGLETFNRQIINNMILYL